MRSVRLPAATIAACTVSWLLAVQDILASAHPLLFLGHGLQSLSMFEMLQGLLFLLLPALLIWRPREDLAVALVIAAVARFWLVLGPPLTQGGLGGVAEWLLLAASARVNELTLLALACWSSVALHTLGAQGVASAVALPEASKASQPALRPRYPRFEMKLAALMFAAGGAWCVTSLNEELSYRTYLAALSALIGLSSWISLVERSLRQRMDALARLMEERAR